MPHKMFNWIFYNGMKTKNIFSKGLIGTLINAVGESIFLVNEDYLQNEEKEVKVIVGMALYPINVLKCGIENYKEYREEKRKKEH